jgi:CheY-like chemotaxis protein
VGPSVRDRGDAEIPLPVDPLLLRGIDVLVVDDEADARALLDVILSAYGAVVRTADAVHTAVDAIEQRVPDVLLSDIGMPLENGYELIRRLRESEAGTSRSIPAIAVTAYASTIDRDKALTAGYQAHIAKPFEPEDVVRLVAAFAHREQIRGS